ncbi:hypothetical protein JX580_08510 [Thiomicrospira microaerophila]|uniref:type II secretion system protein GspL n=1 Tax=Thiomicrospira microaerophila TaxID=406020 RepID=UPI00200D2CA2|nr:type II secretion system protein GspL [Thiomicrospira microaerophila]UQB41709.1 hypothetical protein JX580_08510 [Thiomicrospira microaerophila]
MNSYFDLGDQLHLVESDGLAQNQKPIVWVPSRWVSILRVFVPGKSRHQWQQALPYALEEQLAQPLEELHLVSLDRDKEGWVTVAVLAKQRMQAWLSALEQANLSQAWLVPECFRLDYTIEPTNEAMSPSLWRFAESTLEPETLLVRTAKFSGLSIAKAQWPVFREMAEKQNADLNIEPFIAVQNQPKPSDLARMNLRQGEFAVVNHQQSMWRHWRWPAGLAAVWLVLLGLQTHWQTQQTLQQAQAYQQQTETLFRQLFPQTQRIVNIQVQTQTFLAQAGSQAGQISPVSVLSLLEPVILANSAVKPGRMDWQNQRLTLTLTANTTEQLDQLMAHIHSRLPAGWVARLEVKGLTAQQAEGVLHVHAN